MDKNELEEKWKIVKDQSKVWWSLITDSDLNEVEEADFIFGYLTVISIFQLQDGHVFKEFDISFFDFV